jgi:hypothetical protein
VRAALRISRRMRGDAQDARVSWDRVGTG